MINQEFKAQETKYQVLANFGICCRELGGRGGLKVMSFRACVRNFCSVYLQQLENIYTIFAVYALRSKTFGPMVMLLYVES